MRKPTPQQEVAPRTQHMLERPAGPQPRPLSWLLRIIADIYDARFIVTPLILLPLHSPELLLPCMHTPQCSCESRLVYLLWIWTTCICSSTALKSWRLTISPILKAFPHSFSTFLQRNLVSRNSKSRLDKIDNRSSSSWTCHCSSFACPGPIDRLNTYKCLWTMFRVLIVANVI